MRIVRPIFASVVLACGGAPAPEFPHTFASEAQDAWLEAHCARKGAFDTDANAFNADMKRAGANFAELMSFRDGATMSVKAFACATRRRGTARTAWTRRTSSDASGWSFRFGTCPFSSTRPWALRRAFARFLAVARRLL